MMGGKVGTRGTTTTSTSAEAIQKKLAMSANMPYRLPTTEPRYFKGLRHATNQPMLSSFRLCTDCVCVRIYILEFLNG